MREKVSYADVVDLIETFQKEPEDPDCSFIVASELEEIDGEWHLSIVLSSNTIIDRILHDPVTKSLQIDFTHGLSIGHNTVHLNFILDFAANLDDLLVAMVGTPNSAHEYCPIAISITTGENTRSAVDILKWVCLNHHGRGRSRGRRPLSDTGDSEGFRRTCGQDHVFLPHEKV